MSKDREKITKRRQKRRRRRLKASFKIFITFTVVIISSLIYMGYTFYKAAHAPDPYGELQEIQENEKNNYDLSREVKPDAKYWVLNVGEGEAIYIKCETTDILIDTGSEKDGKAIIKEIKGEISGDLDYLILSSTSYRRIGGLAAVCKELKPKRVITCDLGKDKDKFLKAIGSDAEVEEGKDSVINITEIGTLSIFRPEVSSKDPLDQSLMTFFRYGDTGFFAESDAGEEEEARVIKKITPCDVVVLSRAGSDKVNQLVNELPASTVVISTDKKHGSPSESLVEALKGAIYTTYKSGTIKFVSNGTMVDSNLKREDRIR